MITYFTPVRAITFASLFCFSVTQAQTEITPLGQIARAETVNPIRAGVPGKTPFWNGNAEQFIYAPAFDYRAVPNAAQVPI